ncbi:MAG TPA: (5-formylfuran-3-yl)methyl phosphate synthase, partial [Burkholderiales bacterium]
MTRLLASVADLQEARLAVAGGADIVDFKDPRRGALGALPAATVAECVAALGPAVITSATVGDLPLDPAAL